MRFLLIALVFATGFFAASMPVKLQPSPEIAGVYAMTKGGFNEELKIAFSRDGSYTMDHLLIGCVIDGDGVISSYPSREDGSWIFSSGQVVLTPKARTKDFPDGIMFVPASARRLEVRRDSSGLSLVNPEFPDSLVLKRI